MLKGLGVPYAIIRPTLVFGSGDLLLNNMAWALRRFHVFPVYGNGDYPFQPVYVEDVAAQAVEAGSQSENSVADAAGPDTFSFEALLRQLASAVGVRRRFLHAPPSVALALTGLVGQLMRDVALTRDEVACHSFPRGGHAGIHVVDECYPHGGGGKGKPRKRSWPGDARFPAGRNRRALSRGVAGRETRTS